MAEQEIVPIEQTILKTYLESQLMIENAKLRKYQVMESKLANPHTSLRALITGSETGIAEIKRQLKVLKT